MSRYDRYDGAVGFAFWLVVAILVAAWLLVAPPPSDAQLCDPCPAGSRAVLIKDWLGWPRCICEVAR